VVAPVEPREAAIRQVVDDCPLDDPSATGSRNRPELAEAQATVRATLIRLKQARLRPLIPSLALQYTAAGSAAGFTRSSASSGWQWSRKPGPPEAPMVK